MGDPARSQSAMDLVAPYAGRKGAIFTAMGKPEALRLLHSAFAGNTRATADFLGYASHDTVSDGWKRLGLTAMGNSAPRRGPYPRDARRAASDDAPDAMPTVDEHWFALYERICGETEIAVECDWKLPRGTEYGRLHFVGDVQLGNANCDLRRLKDFIDWLAGQPDDRWIGLGDWFEAANRLSVGQQVMPDDVTMRYACKLFAPIMDQCLVLHTGNHDKRLQIQTGARFDPCAAFAAEFGVPFAGYDGFHRIRLHSGKREQVYTGYCNHGWGAARTTGAQVTQLRRLLQSVDADYVAMGHLHDKQFTAAGTFGPDEDGIVTARHKPAVRCGAWMRHGADSYAREKGYEPGLPGAPTLYLHLDKHDVHTRQ